MDLLIDGRRALLEGLIDYAGLFPPASLDLEAAVAEYRGARSGEHRWMLGRFLCPTSRLEDLAVALTGSMPAGEAPWAVGAIFDEAPGTAALHAAVFDRHMDPAAQVTTVEVRTPPAAADGRAVDAAVSELAPFADAATSVSPNVKPFLEVARTLNWEAGIPIAVKAIADLADAMFRPIGAKLRTGGVTLDAFPSPEQVAVFITSCVSESLSFKATAGLHHPVRHRDPELEVMRHGFLNLLVATALAVEAASLDEIVAALEDTDSVSFTASAAGLWWRGRRFGVGTVRRLRHDVFPAYGSCSFDEPIADLTTMGLLETMVE